MSEQTANKSYADYRQIDLGDGTVLWFAKTRRNYIAVGGLTKSSEGYTFPLTEDEVLHKLFEMLKGVK